MSDEATKNETTETTDATGAPAAETTQATAGDAQSGADEAQAKPSADDFRESLSNLSAAIDRFGRATEARARQEWREGKPEIQRAVDEMKRGLEGLVRKSGEAFDSISRRLNRDDSATNTTPEPADATAGEVIEVEAVEITPAEAQTTPTPSTTTSDEAR